MCITSDSRFGNHVYILVEDVDSELEEGDIVPEESSDDNGEQEKRNALRNRKSLWRTKIVPYEVTDELSELTAVSNVLQLA